MKTFQTFINEDGAAVGGAPANSVGGGGVAGIGFPEKSLKGEPGVNLKKKKKPIVEDHTDPEHFAGGRVFEVDMDAWMKSRHGKNRYHAYSKYVGEDETGEAIRQHGRTTDDDIILKDSKTSVMTYLRRKNTPTG